jgi:hypothetical protein
LSLKVIMSCLALAALPAFGDERLVELPSVLYTTFEQPISVTVRHALEDEVESIIGPLGRHFLWRSISGVKGHEISSELAVLTFKGHCNVANLSFKEVRPGALGWTHVSDGAILPFAEIDCDRIRRFVQKELMYRKPDEREEVFGRAMARVVAHELYHIFANTHHHGSDGVAKAAYSVVELLADDFEFEEAQCKSLRTSIPPKASVPASVAAGSTP